MAWMYDRLLQKTHIWTPWWCYELFYYRFLLYDSFLIKISIFKFILLFQINIIKATKREINSIIIDLVIIDPSYKIMIDQPSKLNNTIFKEIYLLRMSNQNIQIFLILQFLPSIILNPTFQKIEIDTLQK